MIIKTIITQEQTTQMERLVGTELILLVIVIGREIYLFMKSIYNLG